MIKEKGIFSAEVEPIKFLGLGAGKDNWHDIKTEGGGGACRTDEMPWDSCEEAERELVGISDKPLWERASLLECDRESVAPWHVREALTLDGSPELSRMLRDERVHPTTRAYKLQVT